MQKRILITGASGLLGQYLCNLFSEKSNDVAGFWRHHQILAPNVLKIKIDLLDFQAVEKEILSFQPTHVIHCAGLTNVDECERDEKLAERIHIDLTASIAGVTKRLNAKMIHISTDHLWDGLKPLVTEETPLTPINAYARTKAKAEEAVRQTAPDNLIIRTNFFGNGLPWRESFSDWVHHKLQRKESIFAFSDVYYTPISLMHLTNIIADLITASANGTYHVAGADRVSKYEAVSALARHFGFQAKTIIPALAETVHLTAPRPRDMSLSTVKCHEFLRRPMPDLEASIATLS